MRRAGRTGGLVHRECWTERTSSTEDPRGGEKLVLPEELEGRPVCGGEQEGRRGGRRGRQVDIREFSPGDLGV